MWCRRSSLQVCPVLMVLLAPACGIRMSGLVVDGGGGDGAPLKGPMPVGLADGSPSDAATAPQPPPDGLLPDAGPAVEADRPDGRAPEDAPPSPPPPPPPPPPPSSEQLAFGCPPDPALRACYTFDEGGPKLTDHSGKGNHGTRNTADLTAGVRGLALRFLDGKKFAVVPDSPTLRLSGTGFTFEAWIRPTMSPMDGAADFIAGKVVPDGSGFLLGIYDGRVGAWNGGRSSRQAGALDFNTWSHVATVLSETEVIIFIDGSRVHAEQLQPLVLLANSEPMTLGNHDPATTTVTPERSAFYGDVDVLRIYARVKTPEEICADAYRVWTQGVCSRSLIGGPGAAHGLSPPPSGPVSAFGGSP
jgi:Concanavalin A-like lectin/glucanases superfamily